MSPIKITLHLHGPLKDAVGFSEIVMTIPCQSTIKKILGHFFSMHASLQNWQSRIRVAVGVDYVDENFCVEKESEIHLIPPVSGG